MKKDREDKYMNRYKFNNTIKKKREINRLLMFS